MRSMKNLSKSDEKTSASSFISTKKSAASAAAAAASQGTENGEENEQKAKAEAVEWREASAMVEDEPPPVGWSPRDVACLRLLVALVRDICSTSCSPKNGFMAVSPACIQT